MTDAKRIPIPKEQEELQRLQKELAALRKQNEYIAIELNELTAAWTEMTLSLCTLHREIAPVGRNNDLDILLETVRWVIRASSY